MLINTPASQAFETAFDDQSPPVAAEALDKIFDGDGADGEAVAEGEPASESQTPVGESQTDLSIVDDSQIDLSAEQPAAEETLADRLWWDKCEVLESISRCSEIIETVSGRIDGYKSRIKSDSEILKGEQAQLAMYSSQLRDILAGRPLPKNPNADATGATGKESDKQPSDSSNWRDASTRELIKDIKGMGPQKLDRICSLAPTVGQLEDLRGQASVECEPFKSVLPKGCGEELASAIEEKLLDYVARIPVDDYEDASAEDAEPASDDEPIPASDAGE